MSPWIHILLLLFFRCSQPHSRPLPNWSLPPTTVQIVQMGQNGFQACCFNVFIRTVELAAR